MAFITSQDASDQPSKLNPNFDKEYLVEDINFPVYNEGDVILIIDGDVLAYRAASINEYKYEITTPDGVKHLVKSQKSLFDKKEYKKEDCQISHVQVPEPFNYACHTTKSIIKEISKRFKITHKECYVGGSGNFRTLLPLPTIYKGNRENLVKPYHLDNLKEYLLKYQDTMRVKGREADDVVQQRAYELTSDGFKVIVYTNDKDFKQGGYGIMYNPTIQETLEMTDSFGGIAFNDKYRKVEGTGFSWLIYQILMGDKVDGYSQSYFFDKKYSDSDYYKDFSGVKTHKELLEKYIEVVCKLIPQRSEYVDHFGVLHENVNRLDISELYYSCAYMKLAANDNTTLRDWFELYNVDWSEML